jgi:hypothetical protein
VDERAAALAEQGWTWIRGGFADPESAFSVARTLLDAGGALEVIGDFVLPPADGEESRDFQTLHFDFGIPLVPKVPQDVARYTALHIPEGFGRTVAVTRLVPLGALLGQRVWPSRTELLARFRAYGRTYGAWDDANGYVEGSLARIVEAAAGRPLLPSVKQEPGFLCGMEFDRLDSEIRFFAQHSLPLADVQVEVRLSEGELLVFDNLVLAHGRRGSRRPGELRQRVFGEKRVGVTRQRELRDRWLAAFGSPRIAASVEAGTRTVASGP